MENFVYSKNVINICRLNIDFEENLRNFYGGNVFYKFLEKVELFLFVVVMEDFKID